MDLPIKKPSMVSYADDLDFLKFLEDISKRKYNGFMRVTSGSEEGYILFSNGEEVAASYEDHLKADAIEKIKSALDKRDTLVEVFDVKESQIDFLMDLNKKFLLNSDSDIIKELQQLEEPVEELEIEKKMIKGNIEEEVAENRSNEKIAETDSEIIETDSEMISSETAGSYETKQVASKTEVESDKSLKSSDSVEERESTGSTETGNEENVELMESEDGTAESSADLKTFSEYHESEDETSELTEKIESSEPDNAATSRGVELSEKTEETDVKSEVQPPDRSALMKKYGIEEIKDEDVEAILRSYKGGYISEEDIDNIELTLMNKIKKSIFEIPKIKEAKVMVFLDNSMELSGKVSVIIDYESKGFFSRMIGESEDINNLKKQIVNIIQIEIRKNFRQYPEIVDKFDIDVEVT